MAMRARLWIPATIFLAGLAAIAYSVATGEAKVSLVLIFPVFTGSSGLFLLGILLMILSFFVGFAVLATADSRIESDVPVNAGANVQEHIQKKSSFGGVVLIGPFPIAFGSDKNIALAMLVIGVVLAVVLLVALFLLR